MSISYTLNFNQSNQIMMRNTIILALLALATTLVVAQEASTVSHIAMLLGPIFHQSQTLEITRESFTNICCCLPACLFPTDLYFSVRPILNIAPYVHTYGHTYTEHYIQNSRKPPQYFFNFFIHSTAYFLAIEVMQTSSSPWSCHSYYI